MKIGLLRERKNPPDRRVVFSPTRLAEIQKQYPSLKIAVESSPIRVFSDDAYREAGFEVVDDGLCEADRKIIAQCQEWIQYIHQRAVKMAYA